MLTSVNSLFFVFQQHPRAVFVFLYRTLLDRVGFLVRVKLTSDENVPKRFYVWEFRSFEIVEK